MNNLARKLNANNPAILHEKIQRLQTKLANLQAIVDLINYLRRDEGDALTICCDNPDFDGPNSAIICSGTWAGFDGIMFHGDTLPDVLAKAKAARETTEAAGR